MFEDAIKAKEASDSLKAMDIAELVAGAIESDLPVSEGVNTEQPQPEEVPEKETPRDEQPKE